MESPSMDFDMSAWVILSPVSDTHAKLPSPKRQKTTTSTSSGRVLSKKLLSEIASSLNLNYSRMLTIMDEMGFDEQYWPLIESIDRLHHLHAASHSEHVIAARLGELSRLSLLYLIGCLQGLLTIDSVLKDDSEGATQRKELLNACYFLQLAPAVRSEIGKLSDCYEKTLIELLFFSICQNQHTPVHDAPQRIESELLLRDIEKLDAARETSSEYQHVLHKMVFP